MSTPTDYELWLALLPVLYSADEKDAEVIAAKAAADEMLKRLRAARDADQDQSDEIERLRRLVA